MFPALSNVPGADNIAGLIPMAKKYTVKEGEDLGSIAEKFGLVSWKYLYELNQEAIGDNPDLLRPGTRLEIPKWDSTSGDEKIEEKGASPFTYTGGLRYRYPWVPFKAAIIDPGTGQEKEFEEPTEVKITSRDFSATYKELEISKTGELEFLLPHALEINVGIKGFPFEQGDISHIHPDDSHVKEDKGGAESPQTSAQTEEELLDQLLQ